MEPKDWNRCLDNYLQTGKMLSEHYEQMDDFQKAVVQELKKSYKRISYEPVPKDFINDKYKIQ